MKTMLPLVALLMLLSGCSTVSSRIEEKSSVFASLDPQIQARVQQGIVAVGDVSDVVYIALGRPDDTRERVTEAGHETTWIYNNYWQEYEGSQLVGFRRRMFYNPATHSYRSYYEPIRADVYSERVEERTRVSFKDGKVTAIEQVKD